MQPTGRTTTVTELQVINPATGQPWPNNEILISSDPTASDISVARCVDGDFIVTWSACSSTTDWDVYAQLIQRGRPGHQGSIFEVNAYTANVQDSSAVAMDDQGNSTITWQSYGQDGDGYGIYARRFDFNGEDVGGTDEVQMMTFDSAFTGTFRISWDNDNNPAHARSRDRPHHLFRQRQRGRQPTSRPRWPPSAPTAP